MIRYMERMCKRPMAYGRLLFLVISSWERHGIHSLSQYMCRLWSQILQKKHNPLSSLTLKKTCAESLVSIRVSYLLSSEFHISDVKSQKVMNVFSIPKKSLVGGFNPFEKYARQNGFIFPNFRGENSKNVWVATTQKICWLIHSHPKEPHLNQLWQPFLASFEVWLRYCSVRGSEEIIRWRLVGYGSVLPFSGSLRNAVWSL